MDPRDPSLQPDLLVLLQMRSCVLLLTPWALKNTELAVIESNEMKVPHQMLSSLYQHLPKKKKEKA